MVIKPLPNVVKALLEILIKFSASSIPSFQEKW